MMANRSTWVDQQVVSVKGSVTKTAVYTRNDYFLLEADQKEDSEHCFRRSSYSELNVKVPGQLTTIEPDVRFCTPFIAWQAASATDMARA